MSIIYKDNLQRPIRPEEFMKVVMNKHEWKKKVALCETRIPMLFGQHSIIENYQAQGAVHIVSLIIQVINKKFKSNENITKNDLIDMLIDLMPPGKIRHRHERRRIEKILWRTRDYRKGSKKQSQV